MIIIIIIYKTAISCFTVILITIYVPTFVATISVTMNALINCYNTFNTDKIKDYNIPNNKNNNTIITNNSCNNKSSNIAY